jgi:hypothetical protein
MTIILGSRGYIAALSPNFSTNCSLMDRSVPTLCIEALLREASNRLDLPMLIRDRRPDAPMNVKGRVPVGRPTD